MRGKRWRTFKRQSCSSKVIRKICCFLLVMEMLVLWSRTGNNAVWMEREEKSHWYQMKERVLPQLERIYGVRWNVREGTFEIYRRESKSMPEDSLSSSEPSY